MEAVGNSVTGITRSNNEDSIYICGENDKIKNLYLVADGMGGHNGGEIASKSAIEFFLQHVNEHAEENVFAEDLPDLLVGGITYCNEEIYQRSLECDDLHGMGTTFTCVAVAQGKAAIAHVGDSRVYLYRKNSLSQLTKDHSYVMEMVKQGKITFEEAATHPKRNIITRAVGSAATVEIDVLVENLEEKDILLLCSDGLSAMVKDDKIQQIIDSGENLEGLLQHLITEANDNGGRDNISAIIIRFEVEKMTTGDRHYIKWTL